MRHAEYGFLAVYTSHVTMQIGFYHFPGFSGMIWSVIGGGRLELSSSEFHQATSELGVQQLPMALISATCQIVLLSSMYSHCRLLKARIAFLKTNYILRMFGSL